MSRVREEHRRSWIARILALVALIGAATVLIMVVSASLEGSGSDDDEDQRETSGRRIEGCTPSERDALRNGYYIVQPGEPGLSAVSDKTCITLDRLQRLNRDLDPQLIPQSACVNLKPDGCQALAEG